VTGSDDVLPHAGLGDLWRTGRLPAAGWHLDSAACSPVDEQCATTTVRPPDGTDVGATRARLLGEHGIVTTAIGRQRAPDELSGPVLRISPHLDGTVEDLEALAAALRAGPVTSPAAPR
jgi:hercynylcysteine S-oxide lyase